MSGGMRQRVMIAMALSCKPKLLIADEPTTALDVTIQAQILELLRKLQHETGMAIMLITHDLGVVAENADTVAVMYASKVVEFATVEALFDKPQHPYTEGLFRSVPKLETEQARLETIAGNVPNPAKFPGGCKFHPRCPRTRAIATTGLAASAASGTTEINISGEPVRAMRNCVEQEPALREVERSHWAACHYTDNYANAPATVPISVHRREMIAELAPESDAAVSV
jgi:oligopeptide/dipeptide ABC transporter ATP-binding protein